MKRVSETKQTLLEVAMRLIWEQSYGSVGVEDICRKAGVTKGSFYFAFPSKADLAIAAFEEHWQRKQPMLDQIFACKTPPLVQIERYCDWVVTNQREKYEAFGKMCGCPYGSVGSELSTQDEKIRKKAQELMERGLKYLTGAVQQAIDTGSIDETNAIGLARQMHRFISGILLLAKIEYDPETLHFLKPGVFRLLGVKNQELELV